jgi:lipoprotein-anchoring transpeptidase ErfK/SrfK
VTLLIVTLLISCHRVRETPVGIVWIGLNRPSVGMHGTPTPDRIGRNESHRCIGLANWDAFVVSQLVTKGNVCRGEVKN